MKQLLYLFSVALGGIIGSTARYATNLLITRPSVSTFPWSTFVVNICGSLLAGILLALATKYNISHATKLFIFVGILGAFTSFSAFALENFLLFTSGKIFLALTNIVVSNVIGVVVFALGFFTTQFLMHCK